MKSTVQVRNFVECPEAIPQVAEMLFNQWFVSRPGKTLEGLIAQMRQGRDDAIPVGLIGFVDGEPAGTVSLLDQDLEPCGDLRPWLAGLLVAPHHRKKGVADALVRRVQSVARDLGEKEVYLWTEIPALYEGYGWTIVPEIKSGPNTVLMRWQVPS
jgi:GNAT superfamily N-acetyltransferase